MHKAFPLPVMQFPLPEEVPIASEESSHCQKKRDVTAMKIALLLKSRRNCTASNGTGKKKGRTVTVTADDMQKRKNDVKARTTLLLAPEWLMHTIVWRNRSDLDTMSLDDMYNHLKVYVSEVQKKSKTNSQNMAFISSAKHSRGNKDVNTASVSTSSTNVPTASANIEVIDEDDMEDMDIKWNMALLSMRADRRDNYRQGSKVEEQAPKALMAIDRVGWDWRLAQVESILAEHRDRELKYCEKIRGLEFKTESSDDYIESLKKELELGKIEKEGLDSKLTGFQTASKDLDSLLESQRLDKNKEGLGYSAVPPPPAQIYSPPKKDMSWTGKFEAKGDEGYFIGYSMSSKSFRVFNKRTRRVEENLHVEFLENKAIEKGAGLNWLFDIDSLIKSMNYVPVDAESSSSKPQDDCSADVPESSRNSNPTATSTNPLADQLETLIVETPISTVKPSSDTRLILKRVANQVKTPSLDNILALTNWFEDILGVTTNSDESNEVEADVSNMETTITASPTLTLRIHKDHLKSQIIEPKKISDALQDPSWVEAMQEELL
nr:retrovirus-related Pol polyprotein from transposon TNT 1-94 [Tanacetum cinerariifolium]